MELQCITLSVEQVQAVASWLERHQSGWQGLFVEASSKPGELHWNLQHRDGATTSMDVITEADGIHHLRVTGPGTWAYRSFGGVFKSWAATRVVSDQELAALEKMAGAG